MARWRSDRSQAEEPTGRWVEYLSILLRTFVLVGGLGALGYWMLMTVIEQVEKAQYLLLVVLTLPLVGLLAWHLWSCLKEGEMPVSLTQRYQRARHPVRFWLALGWQAAMTLLLAGLNLYALWILL